jgi:transcriptional regulator with XRE-family HTH domain
VQKRKPNRLGQLLDQHLNDTGLSHAEFARRVGLKKGTLSAIRLRQAASGLPKSLNLEKWEKVLGLSHEQSRLLSLFAAVAYSPKQIQDLLEKMNALDSNQ